MTDSFPKPTIGDIDGVPLVHYPLAGPTRLFLLFRGGYSDEALPGRGLAHMAEHVALHGLGLQDVHVNGTVQDLWTVFTSTGTAQDASQFIENLLPGLTSANPDALEFEWRVLRLEQAQREWNPNAELKMRRFGIRGPGMEGVREVGLRWIGTEQLKWWQQKTFVRQNAALAVVGEIPNGLRLSLPDGSRQPVPPPIPLEDNVFPSAISWRYPVVAYSLLAPRSTALTVGLALLAERTTRRLRHELGLVYAISADYAPLDATTAHVAMWAQCQPESAQAVTEEIVSQLDQFAESGPTNDELSAVMRADELADHSLIDAQLVGQALYVARELLLGIEKPLTTDDIRAERIALTPPPIADAFRSARASLLVGSSAISSDDRFPPLRPSAIAPMPLGMRYGLNGPFLRWKPSKWLPGLKVPSLNRHEAYVSPDGVRLVNNETISTIYMRDAVGYERDERVRILYGVDGTSISLRQTQRGKTPAVLRHLDAVVPEEIQFPHVPDQ